MNVEISNTRPRRAGLWAVLGLSLLLLGCAPDRDEDELGAAGAGRAAGPSQVQLQGHVVQPGNAGALVEVDGQQMLVSSLHLQGGAVNLKPGDSVAFGVSTTSATPVAVTGGVTTMRDANGALFQIPSARVEGAAREGSVSPKADDAVAIDAGSAETGMVLSKEGNHLIVLVTRPEGLQLAKTDLSGLQGEDVGTLEPGMPITFAVTDKGVIASRWGEVADTEPVSAQPIDDEASAVGAGAEAGADVGADVDADTDVSADMDEDADDVGADVDTDVDVAGGSR